jgi:membrane protein involved in colicin uptake
MARRSLKPQLNQIRAWVRQGRTDAWIAHQLEVSASELREFRKQHDLTPEQEGADSQEVDLRDEIEAEVEAATAEEAAAEEAKKEEEEAEEKEAPEPAAEEKEAPEPAAEEKEEVEAAAGAEGEGARRRRRRGRRGGRGRRKELEASFDHGERDGYGLWLDPAVKDNPVYAEHWAGRREVTVRIEPDQIVIRRAAGGDDSDD